MFSTNNQELANMDWLSLNHKSKSFSFNSDILINGDQTFQIKNFSENPNSEPFFDYFTLSYDRELKYSRPFEFYSPIKSTKITFIFEGNDLVIWNISISSAPVNLPLNTFEKNATMNIDLPSENKQKFGVFRINDLESVSELILVGQKKMESFKIKFKWSRSYNIGSKRI